MGLFDFLKNSKTHEQKLDIAYNRFDSKIVNTIFINGKKQANEIILGLSKILDINLDKIDESEYYEILDIFGFATYKIYTQASDEDTLKELQIRKNKYLKNSTITKEVFNFILQNFSENIKQKQAEENIAKSQNVSVDNNLTEEELLNKANQLYTNQEYPEAKVYYLEYLNKIEKIVKTNYPNGKTFSSNVEMALYCHKNDVGNRVDSLLYPISAVYMKLAYIDFEWKLFDEAEMFLDKALEWNPYCLPAVYEKGEIYKAKKDLKKYYFNTLDSSEMIYKKSDLARYYRNLGYYFIEKSEWNLAKAVYMYSLKFDFSLVVEQELEYIAQQSGNKDVPKDNELIEILKENRIITEIPKQNIRIINDLYESLKNENQLNTPFGKELEELINQFN